MYALLYTTIALLPQLRVAPASIRAPVARMIGEERVEQIMQARDVDANSARKLIEQHDGWRNSYLRNAHGADWDDPLLYDLTVNTGRISPEAAVDLIVGYVRAAHDSSS